MIDVKEPLRTSYYNLLFNHIVIGASVIPVSDSVQKLGVNVDTYVIMTQQNGSSQNTQNSWMSEETMTLDIVTRGVRVAKSTVDRIASQILMLLFPKPNQFSNLDQSVISIINARVTDDREMVYQITGGNYVTRRIMTITQLVTQADKYFLHYVK